MKRILIILCSLYSISSPAQEKSEYALVARISMLNGSSATSIDMQIINGLRIDKTSFGLGLGLDAYAYRSMPVFLHFQQSFGKASWKPFVYGDLGANFPFYTDGTHPRKDDAGNRAFKMHPGWYQELGFGVNGPVGIKSRFAISLGYSYKQFKYDQYERAWWSSVWPPPTVASPYDYRYKRLAIRFALEF